MKPIIFIFLFLTQAFSIQAQLRIMLGDSVCLQSKLKIPVLIAGEYILQHTCDTIFLVSRKNMQLFRINDQLLQLATSRQDINSKIIKSYQLSLNKSNDYYNALYNQYKSLDRSSADFSFFTKTNLQHASDTLSKVSQTLSTATVHINKLEVAVREELKNAKREKWRYGIGGVLIGGLLISTIALLSR